MSVHVHACGGQTIKYGEHAARLVVDFGEYGFALNEGVRTGLKDRACLDVVGSLQNDVADFTDSTATDGLEVDPLALKLAAKRGERPRLMRKLDHELMCHALRVARAAVLR